MHKNVTFIQNPWENKFLELVDDVNEELFVINPFIKSDIIMKVLASLKNKKMKILLKTNVFDMAKNVFDLESLYIMNKHNVEIRAISNLHAKLFIFDNKKVIVTSSNLTKSGLNSNIEFSILIDDSEFIKENMLPVINEYWERAEKIDIDKIENLRFDLKKINDAKINLLSFEIKPLQISKHSVFISPQGKDILRDGVGLSQNKKYEIIADRLMRERDIDGEEILLLFSKYFDSSKKSINICLGGFEYSFNSDNPFITAGIYYKNVLKIHPDFFKIISANNANMFKNMIMEKGNTNTGISTPIKFSQF